MPCQCRAGPGRGLRPTAASLTQALIPSLPPPHSLIHSFPPLLSPAALSVAACCSCPGLGICSISGGAASRRLLVEEPGHRATASFLPSPSLQPPPALGSRAPLPPLPLSARSNRQPALAPPPRVPAVPRAAPARSRGTAPCRPLAFGGKRQQPSPGC